MRIVEVEWIDTVSQGGWRTAAEVVHEASIEDTYHRSVGYLLNESDEYVLLGQSRGENSNMVADTLQIPRIAVRSVHDLRRK